MFFFGLRTFRSFKGLSKSFECLTDARKDMLLVAISRLRVLGARKVALSPRLRVPLGVKVVLR